MKNIIRNTVTFLIAIVGLIGGGIWAYKSSWETEPIILFIISFIEIVGFLFIKITNDDDSIETEIQETKIKNQQTINNEGGVNKQVNIQKNKGDIKF